MYGVIFFIQREEINTQHKMISLRNILYPITYNIYIIYVKVMVICILYIYYIIYLLVIIFSNIKINS